MKPIRIKNLSFSYPDKKNVLNNINLEIHKNETVAVIGPNGAGKTTLLLHLNGILRSQNSDIEIFGLEINDKNIFEIRKRVGLIFENPDDQLFMPTVFEDIAFGLLNLDYSTDEIQKKVENILILMGLKGYNNRISHHLSHGEKKRVALATVLVLKPEILVFDEPMSGLDPYCKREFVELIKEMEATKIIATHDLEMVKNIADRVVVMNRGEITKNSTPTEIFYDKDFLLKSHLI